ncbi:MAG TPA: sensor histidine kinase [Gammaproteobacteria bacterium]
MRLRSHLFALVGGALLPMMVFGAAATALFAHHERDIIRRLAMDRTRAVVTALDTELAGHLRALRTLALSRSLEAGELELFYDEARRMLQTHPHWQSVRLALPSGEHVLDTELPFGAARGPPPERDSFEQVLRTGEPTLGDLFFENGVYHFAVRLPVAGNPDVAYILSAVIDPAAVLALLSPQRLDADWVVAVLDRNQRVVARLPEQQQLIGRLASRSLRSALVRAPEGWFRGQTLEGAEVYSAFMRSPQTGWAVSIGMPAAAVRAGVLRSFWLLALGFGAAAAVSVAVAAALGRRVAEPMSALASAAGAIERGEELAPPALGGITEVRAVGRALERAARAVAEREEALRAADNAKDEFLAMLGHELRNPLGALAAAVEVLRLTASEDEHQRKTVALLARQVQHMTRLVDDLLDVSRVTRGKITLSIRRLDLGEVAQHAVAACRAGRGSEHRFEVETSSAFVQGDEARLEQVIANLVNNAVKYTPPGGKITVRVRREGDEAVAEVIDTGMGLTPELAVRAFDLFVQGDQSLGRSGGGLGIGLTLVKRLVELHGGSVRAESPGPGLGSKFTVRLPAVS